MYFQTTVFRCYQVLAGYSPLLSYGVLVVVFLPLLMVWYLYCYLPLSASVDYYRIQGEYIQRKTQALNKRLIQDENTQDEHVAHAVDELELSIKQKCQGLSDAVQPQVSAIFSLIKKKNIILKAYEPHKKQTYSEFCANPYTLTLEGTYEDIIQFLTGLGDKDCCAIESCALTYTTDKVTCMLKLFFFSRVQ